jgi:DNA sulfur modification protein DndC
MRLLPQLIEDIKFLAQEIQELYRLGLPIILGYSGGKDSSVVVQLFWNAIARLPQKERTRPIHVITTDTRVENPIIASWVNRSLSQMEQAAKEQNMPFRPHLLTPAIKDSFWVCLIGKGYPAPRTNFRWCTDRLKIKPSNTFIRNTIRENGETILGLGIRKGESAARSSAMKKRELGRVRDRISPNASLPGSLIYSPIEDWRTDEVWLYLNQWPNPWGVSNKELFTLYRGATADNECPLVVDTSTPSCGSSRFGCWVCTMVDKDKSMEAMIQNDEDKEWMQPLLDLRDELDLEDDSSRREFRRLNGNIQFFTGKDGKAQLIRGPYLKEWRETWLRKLLNAQVLTGIPLISLEELREIRSIWVNQKHELDDTLPRIYEEVIGEPFPSKQSSPIQELELEVLDEVCGGDKQFKGMIVALLSIEHQYSLKHNRKGILSALDSTLEQQSLSEEDAVSNAKSTREFKQAIAQDNVQTWAQLKFKS